MKILKTKPSPLSSILLALVLLNTSACVDGGTPREGGFEGPQLGQINTEKTSLTGEVLFSKSPNAPILVEARKAIACPQGFCPMIGQPALASVQLKKAGAFTLFLEQVPFPLVVIATYQSNTGATRVAHQVIQNHEELKPVLLSLDRPYEPIR